MLATMIWAMISGLWKNLSWCLISKGFTTINVNAKNGSDRKTGQAYYGREGDLLMEKVEPFDIINNSLPILVEGEHKE